MNWGYLAYAALMAALIVAYFQGVRSYGMSFKRMALVAAIWVAIIGGGYLLVTWVSGTS